jgi:hypothetical protein
MNLTEAALEMKANELAKTKLAFEVRLDQLTKECTKYLMNIKTDNPHERDLYQETQLFLKGIEETKIQHFLENKKDFMKFYDTVGLDLVEGKYSNIHKVLVKNLINKEITNRINDEYFLQNYPITETREKILNESLEDIEKDISPIIDKFNIKSYQQFKEEFPKIYSSFKKSLFSNIRHINDKEIRFYSLKLENTIRQIIYKT